MMTGRTYDIFITHAWRYHEDWTRVAKVLDQCAEFFWRNFSVPWYDPAMDTNTEKGGRFVHRWLESQIIPVDAVLFLSSVYAVRSARKWLELEVETARRLHKPVIGLARFGESEIAIDARPLIDSATSWEPETLAAAIREATGDRAATA
jgi:hypothetical protein